MIQRFYKSKLRCSRVGQLEMGIQFLYTVWHETLCIFNTGSTLIWLWLWADFVFLWFILCVVKYNPLHDSCNKIKLSFKPLVTKSDPFHKFVLVFSLLLNFVLYFMSYRSLMVIWFSYIFDYIPIQYWFWIYWIIFKKISLSLNPSSLGSTLGITSSGAVAGDGGVKISSLGKNDNDQIQFLMVN